MASQPLFPFLYVYLCIDIYIYIICVPVILLLNISTLDYLLLCLQASRYAHYSCSLFIQGLTRYLKPPSWRDLEETEDLKK